MLFVFSTALKTKFLASSEDDDSTEELTNDLQKFVFYTLGDNGLELLAAIEEAAPGSTTDVPIFYEYFCASEDPVVEYFAAHIQYLTGLVYQSGLLPEEFYDILEIATGTLELIRGRSGAELSFLGDTDGANDDNSGKKKGKKNNEDSDDQEEQRDPLGAILNIVEFVVEVQGNIVEACTIPV